ncbi:MAG TPA: pyrroloquinoline quinone biosynthesis protein PqqC [Dehalococcoidia bacterium]|nr:pyrroloquinoline quinone biosynthesis protein PqqC [Dehalococcoidia bacterium]|tara:strand:+ start:456 stop:1139 length:684 start_codon:yes stop_codon:yes gene_type:complete
MYSNVVNKLQEVIDSKSILNHPFYQAWQKGELTKEDLKLYAEQYYFFESSFPQRLSTIHSKCDDAEARQAILINLWDEEHGENNHSNQWLNFCYGLGLDTEEVKQAELMPTTKHLINTYTTICDEQDFRHGLSIMYAWEYQVPKVATEKIVGLRKYFDLNEDSLEFFKVHSTEKIGHHEAEAESINNSIEETQLKDVLISVNEALDAMWMFLDGIEESREKLTAIAD